MIGQTAGQALALVAAGFVAGAVAVLGAGLAYVMAVAPGAIDSLFQEDRSWG